MYRVDFWHDVGDILNPIKKGNLFVILIVAIIAFGTSTAVTSFTSPDVIFNMLNITNNQTIELIAVSDGNFTPLIANQVIEVTNNTTNVTNDTNITDTNNSNITDNIKIIKNMKNNTAVSYQG